jgi:hypothetical protein
MNWIKWHVGFSGISHSDIGLSGTSHNDIVGINVKII